MEVNSGDILAKTSTILKNLCTANKIHDHGLVLDVYRCCNNNGTFQFISDEDLLNEIETSDPAYWGTKLAISERKEFLESMAKSNYMAALIALNDPMKAVNTFVSHLANAHAARTAALKNRQPIGPTGSTVGVSGYINARNLADMQQAADAARAAMNGGSEEFDAILNSFEDFAASVSSDQVGAFLKGASSAEYSGCGLPGSYISSNYGGALSKAVVQTATNLPIAYSVLWKEFTRISDSIGSTNMKEVDSDEEKDRKKRERMLEYEQVSSMDPVDLAKDNFDVDFAQKKLDVNYNLEEEQGVCHTFILLDVSGSMDCCDLGGRVSRAFAANVISLALLNFALKDKWRVWIVPFAGSVGVRHLHEAKDKDSALAAMNWLGGQNYDGEGTDIEGAVLWAYKKLGTQGEYRKADICLITDGCSPISNNVVSMKPSRAKLRTLVVSEEIPYGDSARKLAAASDTYKKVTWNNRTNELDLGDALSGISDRSSNDAEEDIMRRAGQACSGTDEDPDSQWSGDDYFDNFDGFDN